MKIRKCQRGTAMIELAMLVPMIVFLFIGTLDMGFYCYGLITVEGAARVAAIYTSSSSTTLADSSGACTFVLAELRSLPNVANSLSTCGGGPVTVTAQSSTGAGLTSASIVSVTYQSLPLIPIPGLLASQFTWTRTVKMAART
jgi:Flp pilus assembly protein TadG